MIRSLIWKEYREQRAIWLTLAVVGGGGLYGLSRLMAPEGFLSDNGSRESLQTVAVLFAWTYGLVCGAMLLANEHESGTIVFLDMLPARRLQLWLVKFSFGLFLLLSQVAVLGGFVIVLGITDTSAQLQATLLGMLVSGLIALSWSLLFSAIGANVLNVIGFSFVGQIAGAILMLLLMMPVAIVLALIRSGQTDESSKVIVFSLGFLGLAVAPMVGSARFFSRLDRERWEHLRDKWDWRRDTWTRLLGGRGRSAARRPSGSEWASWGRLLWLSYGQMRRLLIGLTIFSLTVGLALPLMGPAAWPGLTLLLGVLCGVTVWSDEQLSAAFRFLGDQRLPLGRVWIVKVGMRFTLAVFAAFLLLLPSLVLAMIHRIEADAPADSLPFAAPPRVPFFADLLHSSLVGPIVPIFTHLSMWLLYGFAAGHLCGLLFRKSLVAAVVALGSAGMLVSLWIPSLVGVGLHFWQVAGVPLLLLVACWLLMPAWTADRLLARSTFVRLGAILFAAAIWTVGGLWYRIVEIPDIPDAFDMPSFIASIPSLDPTTNGAGMAIHAAWHEVELLAHELNVDPAQLRRPLFPKQPPINTFNAYRDEIGKAYSNGWPPNHPSDLGDRLDAQFQKEWYRHVKSAANFPDGAVEDAKLMMIRAHLGQWHHLEFLNRVLAVRGLQMQARGDHKVFVDHLRISLALSRNVQNHAPMQNVHAGRDAELVCVDALDRWLEKLPGHPELLQRARDALLQHEILSPNERDVLKTAYLIALNTLNGLPEQLVEWEIGETKNRPFGSAELQKAEMDLVSHLWRIPWEHERHQRILRVIFEGPSWQRRQAAEWGGSILSSRDLRARRDAPRPKRRTVSLHAAQVKVAIRLYQAHKGNLPASLDELVTTHYLPAVPVDPFSNQQLRYRVLHGAGGRLEALVWSVGEDGHDDGGKPQNIHQQQKHFGEDLIFPVPPPPR